MPDMTHPRCPYCSTQVQQARVIKPSGMIQIACTTCNAVAPAAFGDNQAWLNWDRFATNTRQQRVYKED